MSLPRTLRYRGVPRDDASIVPYMGCGNAGFAVGRRVARAHNVRPYMGCGNAGFAVGRGVARAHNVRPYMGCGGAGFAVGRGVSRPHNVRPYMGCGNAGFAVGRGVSPVRRGGFHIRPGRRRAAGSGACRGLQPPSAAVVPRFFIKALRFPGWRFWRAVRPAIRRWGFRRIFRSIRPQGSGAAFPAGSCACRRSW